MIERLFELVQKIASNGRLLLKLGLVLFALLLLLFYFWRSASARAEEIKSVQPAYVALKCSKCSHAEDMRIFSLADDNPKCSVCGGRMGYRMKCQDCDFEFAFFPQSVDTVDTIKDQDKRRSVVTLLNQRMCPNCGGPKTSNVSPQKIDPALENPPVKKK